MINNSIISEKSILGRIIESNKEHNFDCNSSFNRNQFNLRNSLYNNGHNSNLTNLNKFQEKSNCLKYINIYLK